MNVTAYECVKDELYSSSEDEKRLDKAAKFFLKRHGLFH